MEKDIKAMKSNQSEVNNTTSDTENTLEGRNRSLGEAENWVSYLEDKEEKTLNQRSKNKLN